MIINPETLKIAVRFNPDAKQWIARHTNVVQLAGNPNLFREHQYGQGESLMEAVDAVVFQASKLATKVLCKVMTPSRKIHTIKLD
jgi:hypothetical protein